MPIANEMKNIAEGIEVSYGERAAFVSDLGDNTHQTLKTFNREHRQMSTDLGDFLTSNRDNRQKIVASLRGQNQRELRAMAEQLAHLLKQSRSSMKEDTAKLMAQIKEGLSSIREDLSSMEKEIAGLLSRFDQERQSMGRQIKTELVSTTRGRIEQVKKILADFSAEHKAQSRQLRHQLSTFQKELESTVKDMRVPVIRDLKQARQNWQNLARIMAAKRAGKAETVAKKIDEEPKEKIAEAKTKIEDVVSAVKLKEQMMRLISAATSGVSLSRMGKTLGIPYIRLAKPASELVKQGEIKKQDSEYFKV